MDCPISSYNGITNAFKRAFPLRIIKRRKDWRQINEEILKGYKNKSEQLHQRRSRPVKVR
jgi:hypothetical protein